MRNELEEVAGTIAVNVMRKYDPYIYGGKSYNNVIDLIVAILQDYENERTRLTEREMRILNLCVAYHKELDRIKGWCEGRETLVQEVIDKLGFEVDEEDIKQLIGVKENS